MLCSIAMSTYNGSEFLARQLDSILSQTRPVDEIVISDDASADRTLEIIDRCRSAHPEIRWKVLASQHNQGFRMSFRRAIMHCTGDLIFLCDQDDVWLPGKIEKVERVFSQNPQILSLITDFKTIGAQDQLLNPDAGGENLWVADRVFSSPDPIVKLSLREMLGRNQGQGCAMAIRRSLAEEYIALDKVWTHDWILNLIAAMHGGLYFCKEQLLHYRLHGSNLIGMAQGEHARRSVSFSRKLYEFALSVRYTLLEGSGAACRESLLSVTMDKYDFVFDKVSCGGEEAAQLAAWQAFQRRRLSPIENRRLVSYLLFWLGNQQFFRELAYFSTYEQFINRLMMDLCAIIKRG